MERTKENWETSFLTDTDVRNKILDYLNVEFKKGNTNYLAIKLQPQQHGSEGIRVLYEYIVEGKDLANYTTTSGVVVGYDEYQNYEWE